MNVTQEEKSKAQILLKKCKEHEKTRKLIPVKIGNSISVMMPSNFTKKEIEEKRRKYLK